MVDVAGLLQYGVAGIVLAALLSALWVGGKAVAFRMAGWIDRVLDHWIASGKERDASMIGGLSRLFDSHHEHEVEAEKRHRAELAAIHGTAKETRHEFRQEMTAQTLSIEGAVREAREYLCERHDQTQERLRDIAREETGDLDPNEGGSKR